MRTVHVLPFLLAAPLLAQEVLNPPTNDPSYELDVRPAGYASDLFLRMVVGDFNDDLSMDAAVVKGGAVKVLIDPGRFESSRSLGGSWTDVAALVDPATSKDTLLVADASGVYSVLEATLMPQFLVGWGEAALFVRAGNLDAQANDEIVVVVDGATTEDEPVLRVLAYASGAWSEVATRSILSTQARDVILLDKDGDGDDEIALLTNSGVEVYDFDSSTGLTFLLGLAATTGDALAPVQIADVVGEQLLTVARYPELPDQYLRVAYSGTSLADPVMLGEFEDPPDVVAAATGDWNCDGKQDCVLSVQSTTDLWVLLQADVTQPTTESPFDGTYSLVRIGDGYPAPNNHAHSVLVDLDDDTDPEIAHPVQGTASFFVMPNPWFPEDMYRPQITGAPTFDDSELETSKTGTFSFSLAPAPSAFEYLLPGPDPEEVEVTVWRAHYEPALGRYETEHDGIQTVWAPIAQTAFSFELDFENDPGSPTVVIDGGPIYYFVVRYVDTESGALSAVHPAQVYYVYLDGNFEAESYTGALPGSVTPWPVYAATQGTPRLNGSYAPADCIPDFESQASATPLPAPPQ